MFSKHLIIIKIEINFSGIDHLHQTIKKINYIDDSRRQSDKQKIKIALFFHLLTFDN